MIARNMPKRETLNALTTRAGMIFPAMIPQAVPAAQQGMAVSMAPDNFQYRLFLQQLQQSGATYRSRGRSFGVPAALCSSPCLSCVLLNLICNFCCGGYWCFC